MLAQKEDDPGKGDGGGDAEQVAAQAAEGQMAEQKKRHARHDNDNGDPIRGLEGIS